LKSAKTTPKWLLLSAPIALLTLFGGGGMAWWNGITAPPSNDLNAKSISIQIKSGSTVQAIGQELETKGAIKSQLAWKLDVVASQTGQRLPPKR
jgi:UPF0755 protein